MNHINNFAGFVNELYDSPDVPKLLDGEEYNLAAGLFKKPVVIKPIVDQQSGALKLLDTPLTVRLPWLVDGNAEQRFERRLVGNDTLTYRKSYNYGIVTFFNGMEEETHYTQSCVPNPAQKDYMIVTTKEGWEWDILKDDMRLDETLFNLDVSLTITQASNRYNVRFDAGFSNESRNIGDHDDFSVELHNLSYHDIMRKAAAQVDSAYQALHDYCYETFQVNL